MKRIALLLGIIASLSAFIVPASAISCSLYARGCNRDYPTEAAQCQRAANACYASCNKTTNTATWIGHRTGQRYTVACS
jgi:hypothetical protein